MDTVYTVTRNPERATEFQALGFHPIVADVTDLDSLKPIEDLQDVDTVLIAIGMDRSRYDRIESVYVDGLRNLLSKLPAGCQIIYVSSTGVYGDFGGAWVDEDSPTQPKRDGGIACLKAERLIKDSKFSNRAKILRFAGIYGPDRVPTKSLIETHDWKKLSSDGFLNLIHVEDGAQLISMISDVSCDLDAPCETFCVSDGYPVLRKDYYSFIARTLGLNTIPWEKTIVAEGKSRSGSNKRVSNKKLVMKYPFQFAYPSYREGVEQAIGASTPTDKKPDR